MSSESKWLIRSSGRISGPFSKGQIPQLLKSREVQLRDEIAAPQQRWRHIEFHPDFTEDVDFFKRQVMHENTEVSLTPTGTHSNTQTLTDLNGDMTEEITNDLSGFTSTEEIVVNDVKEFREDKPINSKDIYSAQYQLQGLKNNSNLDRKVKETSRWIQWAALFLVLVLAGGFFFMTRQKPTPTASLSEKDYKATVLNEIQLGNYSSALNLLKSRSSQPNFVEEYGIYYSILLIQVEQQTLLARRAMEQLQNVQPQSNVRVLTGLGLSYLFDGQLSKASEYFSQALNADRGFTPARIDEFTSAYLSRNYSEVSRILSENKLPLEPEAILTRAFYFLESDDKEELKKMQSELSRYLQGKYDFRFEGQIAKGLIDTALSGQSLSLTTTRDLLDSDPNLTSDHRHNLFVYRGHLEGPALLSSCMKLGDRIQKETDRMLFKAVCQFRAKAFQQSRAAIEQVVDHNPKNALIQAWYALVLRETGSPDQASVALGRAMEANRRDGFRLPFLLQARFCESANNTNCAYESWKSLLELDYNNLAAITGMAALSQKNGNNAEAKKMLTRGLTLSPDYKPLLAIRAQRMGEP